MAHIVTLKDHNDEISYPITPVDAVFVDSNTTLSDELTGIIDKIYPVGSIYMSATLSTASAVGNALGGTWEAWGTGRVPVGVDTSQTEFDTVEETGGEKTHTLTVDEMPSHRHEAKLENGSFSGGSGHLKWSGAETTYQKYNASVEPYGGDQPHNNLQPYITCYMYKRTA